MNKIFCGLVMFVFIIKLIIVPLLFFLRIISPFYTFYTFNHSPHSFSVIQLVPISTCQGYNGYFVQVYSSWTSIHILDGVISSVFHVCMDIRSCLIQFSWLWKTELLRFIALKSKENITCYIVLEISMERTCRK